LFTKQLNKTTQPTRLTAGFEVPTLYTRRYILLPASPNQVHHHTFSLTYIRRSSFILSLVVLVLSSLALLLVVAVVCTQQPASKWHKKETLDIFMIYYTKGKRYIQEDLKLRYKDIISFLKIVYEA
jgi:hypothetical protein